MLTGTVLNSRAPKIVRIGAPLVVFAAALFLLAGLAKVTLTGATGDLVERSASRGLAEAVLALPLHVFGPASTLVLLLAVAGVSGLWFLGSRPSMMRRKLLSLAMLILAVSGLLGMLQRLRDPSPIAVQKGGTLGHNLAVGFSSLGNVPGVAVAASVMLFALWLGVRTWLSRFLPFRNPRSLDTTVPPEDTVAARAAGAAIRSGNAADAAPPEPIDSWPGADGGVSGEILVRPLGRGPAAGPEPQAAAAAPAAVVPETSGGAEAFGSVFEVASPEPVGGAGSENLEAGVRSAVADSNMPALAEARVSASLPLGKEDVNVDESLVPMTLEPGEATLATEPRRLPSPSIEEVLRPTAPVWTDEPVFAPDAASDDFVASPLSGEADAPPMDLDVADEPAFEVQGELFQAGRGDGVLLGGAVEAATKPRRGKKDEEEEAEEDEKEKEKEDEEEEEEGEDEDYSPDEEEDVDWMEEEDEDEEDEEEDEDEDEDEEEEEYEETDDEFSERLRGSASPASAAERVRSAPVPASLHSLAEYAMAAEEIGDGGTTAPGPREASSRLKPASKPRPAAAEDDWAVWSDDRRPAPRGVASPRRTPETPETAPSILVDKTLYERALNLVSAEATCSPSLLQRSLGVSFPLASTLLERMQSDGLVGAPRAAGLRDVITEEFGRRPRQG